MILSQQGAWKCPNVRITLSNSKLIDHTNPCSFNARNVAQRDACNLPAICPSIYVMKHQLACAQKTVWRYYASKLSIMA